MSEIARILSEIDASSPQSAERLLPLVYDELRKLAAAKLAQERPGHSLQATALVHEAYLRLTGDDQTNWDSRGHFFAAAAEAMRRILVESARRRARCKRGGDLVRQELHDDVAPAPMPQEDVLALDEALDKLAVLEPLAARLVQLRYFAGCTLSDVARILGISPSKADRLWAYARAWLHQEIQGFESTT